MPIGIVSLVIEDDDPWEIAELAVDKDYQGQGYGTKIMNRERSRFFSTFWNII